MTAAEGRGRRLAGTIAGAAGLIAALTLLARIAGFARVLVFASSVRARGVGEVYQSVNALPNVLFEIAAGGVLAAVAVPLIAHRLGAGDRASADRLADALLSWALVILIPLAVLLAVLARPLATFLIADFDPVARDVGTTLLRIFAIQVPLYGVGIILTGLLQAHRRFLAAALAPLLSSVVVLVSYAWYGTLVGGSTAPSVVSGQALAVLGWGTTAGVAVLSLPLVLPALRTGWRWHPGLRFPVGTLGRVGRLAGAGILALLAQQGAVLVTMWLANHAGDRGAFPVYQYVQAVYLLPYAVLAVPLATSAFPALAHSTGAGKDASMTLARTLRALLWLAAAAAAALLVVAPAVAGFFSVLDARKGAAGASPQSLAALAAALAAYAPGLIGFAVSALLTRALYVRGRALMAGAAVAAGWLVAALGPLLTVGAGASAARTLQMLGVWSSVGMTLSACALGMLVRRSWGATVLAGLTGTLARVVVVVALAVVAGDLVRSGRDVSTLGGSLGVGAASGLITLVVALGLGALLERSRLGVVRARGRAIRAERRGSRQGSDHQEQYPQEREP